MAEMDLLTFWPGLIMMAVLPNTFADPHHHHWSLVRYRQHCRSGHAPLSAYELFIGMVAAGITRGVMVAIVALITMPLLGINIMTVYGRVIFLLWGLALWL